MSMSEDALLDVSATGKVSFNGWPPKTLRLVI